mmetsp:Transcript_29109/g.76866  ORF Transcript_29109/g.76866 Transcript_29109/m.76866 type:complete len:204 (-) Transcript_29109:664-1275(-)
MVPLRSHVGRHFNFRDVGDDLGLRRHWHILVRRMVGHWDSAVDEAFAADAPGQDGPPRAFCSRVGHHYPGAGDRHPFHFSYDFAAVCRGVCFWNSRHSVEQGHKFGGRHFGGHRVFFCDHLNEHVDTHEHLPRAARSHGQGARGWYHPVALPLSLLHHVIHRTHELDGGCHGGSGTRRVADGAGAVGDDQREGAVAESVQGEG